MRKTCKKNDTFFVQIYASNTNTLLHPQIMSNASVKHRNALNFLTLLKSRNFEVFSMLGKKETTRNHEDPNMMLSRRVISTFRRGVGLAAWNNMVRSVTLDTKYSGPVICKYIRCSSKEQIGEFTLDVQSGVIDDCIKSKSRNVSSDANCFEFIEQSSAYKSNPPILAMLFECLTDCTIVMSKSNRLSRNIRVTVNEIAPAMLRNRIELVFADENNGTGRNVILGPKNYETGMLQLTKDIIEAHVDSAKKSESIRNAGAWKDANNIPRTKHAKKYGFDVVMGEHPNDPSKPCLRYVPNEYQQSVIRFIVEMREPNISALNATRLIHNISMQAANKRARINFGKHGVNERNGMTFTQIARYLNDYDVLYDSGPSSRFRWTPGTVSNVYMAATKDNTFKPASRDMLGFGNLKL